MDILRFLMVIDSKSRRRFALAALLGAVAAASSVVLLALSGWFIVASAVAGAAGGALAFNYLFPSAGVRGAAFTRVLGKYGEQLAGHDAILALSARLRSRLFERIARSTPGGVAPGAEELSLIADHVEAVEGAFLRVVLPAVSTATAALIAIVITARVDALAAVALAAAVFLASIAGPLLAFRRAREQEKEAARLNDEMRKLLSDYADGAPELIAYGADARAASDIMSLSENSLDMRRRIEAPHQLQSAATLGLGFLVAAFVLWRGEASDAAVALSAGASLAALAALQMTSVMTQTFDALARADEAARRIKSRLLAPDAVSEPNEALAADIDNVLPLRLQGVITSPAPGVSLAAVTFDINAGEIVELSGRSGSGKTTIIETILKLRDPASGQLTYAGADWRALRAAAVRRRIGYAPQTPIFLSGDVEANLRLANPSADAAAIDAALKTANIDGVISATPAGLATELRNGAGFSGGELRRLGIARALLSSPELLILDEPFAGLDEEMATKLARNLVAWKTQSGGAILYTSHQPNPALPADKVIRIEA
ncbi:MAG TPA: ATP-binding cassette domain-containing protein [Parvularculaceae bacterium]|nr:ATP-binding cassette domain-containing protein [Parvularculaceae bacterium]